LEHHTEPFPIRHPRQSSYSCHLNHREKLSTVHWNWTISSRLALKKRFKRNGIKRKSKSRAWLQFWKKDKESIIFNSFYPYAVWAYAWVISLRSSRWWYQLRIPWKSFILRQRIYPFSTQWWLRSSYHVLLKMSSCDW